VPRRRKAREYALQLLYQWEGERGDPAALLSGFWRGVKADAATRRFAEELFTGTAAALDELDPLIAAHSEHWRLDRMASIDRCLLRLALHELRAHPETPAAVVIDEALEIAKRFSSSESVEFINGVLDAARKTLASRSGVKAN